MIASPPQNGHGFRSQVTFISREQKILYRDQAEIMENKENLEKFSLDFQELEKVTGGLSEQRKALLRDYVEYFKGRYYTLEGIKRNWAERGDNAGISAAALEEDYRYIESIY